ncbi:MAG: glycosyltransferase [Verrucomicrobiota bacterium]
MKIATIIPCYNHERYIAGAIESVLRQTRRPERLLVIDDGSSDGSVEVIKGFEGEDGFSWRGRENRGAHATINELVEWAEGEECDAVSILNSDDAYEKGRLASLVNVLEMRPEVEVVCSELNIMDDNGEALSMDHARAKWFRAIWSMKDLEPRDYCVWLGTGNFVATTSNVVARTSFARRFPFRPYRFNHDYYFLAQAVVRGGLELVEEPLVRYRVHESNTMNVAPAPLLKEMLRMHLDLYRDLAEELGEDGELRGRFGRYVRASGGNISALHGGMLQVLLARGLGKWTEEELEEMVLGLDDGLPELATYPNKELVNAHDGSSPVAEGAGLAEVNATLKAERAALKEELEATRELAKLRNELLQSKGVAWKRLLGKEGDLVSDRGKTAREKVRNLRNAMRGL